MHMSGGGKGGGSSLKSKDATQILNQQSGISNEAAYRQALLNNMNQSTPFGTINYSPTPGSASYKGLPTQYNVTTRLSPGEQGIYDTTTGIRQTGANTAQDLLGAIAPKLSHPINLSSLGAVPGMDSAGGRDALTAAIMQRMAPDIEADRARSETRLANQGITAGSEAFNDANRRLEQNINDQRTSAYIGGAGEEQNRQLQARQQAISEKLLRRNQPLSEIMTLLGAAPTQTPSAQGTSQTGIQPANAASAYQMLMGQQQGQQQLQQQLLGGLFGLGGGLGSAAILASDRRLKSDIVPLGKVTTGKGALTLYAYTIFGGRTVGFMADEVEAIDPAAVHTIGGYQVVDYGRLLG